MVNAITPRLHSKANVLLTLIGAALYAQPLAAGHDKPIEECIASLLVQASLPPASTALTNLGTAHIASHKASENIKEATTKAVKDIAEAFPAKSAAASRRQRDVL